MLVTPLTYPDISDTLSHRQLPTYMMIERSWITIVLWPHCLSAKLLLWRALEQSSISPFVHSSTLPYAKIESNLISPEFNFWWFGVWYVSITYPQLLVIFQIRLKLPLNHQKYKMVMVIFSTHFWWFNLTSGWKWVWYASITTPNFWLNFTLG